MRHDLAKGVRRSGVILGVCFLTFALVPAASPAQSETNKNTEKFTATAFGQGGMFSGKSVMLNIYINNYTTDEEVQELAATLKNKGSDALLDAVQRMKESGRVSTVASTGWRVPVVRQRATDKGRRIVMFGDRPVSFYEAVNAPRSKTYEFGMLVLNVNDKGEGDGLLYGACKIKFNSDNQLEVEHYGQAPARLTGVKLWK